jgi:hypothetical protein
VFFIYYLSLKEYKGGWYIRAFWYTLKSPSEGTYYMGEYSSIIIRRSKIMGAQYVDIDRREKALGTMNVKGHGYEYYKDLLGRFLDLLKENFGNRLLSFVLYGSVARGEAREDSDIDLLIILEI